MTAVPDWATLLARYSVREDSEPGRQLRLYRVLLERWGARINLSGSMEWPALAPLFEEALWAARLSTDAPLPLRHVDIGSGGGFPMIPIKILNPSLRATLIESRERRAFFLERVALELGLRDLSVECCRFRDYAGRSLRRAGWERASWKAVRLAYSDWSSFLRQAGERAEAWMFHGEKLPVDDESRFLAEVELTKKHAVPSRTGSWLSIFKVRPILHGS